MDLNSAQEVHLSHYWNIIYKRWKIAAAILIVVMLGTYLASQFSTPLYRSSVMLQIERENPNQLTLDDLFGIEISDQEFMQTQYYLLKSHGLAERTIQDHRLLEDREFYSPGIAGKKPAEIDKIRAAQSGGLAAAIDVNPVRGTSLVEIAYVSTSPRLAQKIAEAVGDTFMRNSVEKKLDAVHQASEFLTKQIETTKAEVEASQEQLNHYGESRDIVNTADASNVTVQKMNQLNSDFTNAQNDRIQKAAAYDAIVHASADTIGANDSLVLQLSAELSRLERDYAQKLNVYRPEHPDMLALRTQVEKTRQARQNALLTAYAQRRDLARSEMLASENRESSMKQAYETQKHEVMRFNANATTYTDLRSQIESKRTLLDQLTKRLNETEVTSRLRGSNTSNIHWVDHAQLPGSRFNVTMKKNLQSAFPLGIILGLAAIFFLEYMDRSIKTSEELERVTRFASLGVIPSAGSVSRSAGYSYGYGTPRLRAVEPA